MRVKRGEIYYADLGKPVGSELGDLDHAISVSLGLFRQRGNACA